MKVCILQPHYSTHYEDVEACFDAQLALLDTCDESMDMIVCPEACDIPAFAETQSQFTDAVVRFNERMRKAASETAKRCHAIL
ncbi:MAG: hypothetical protein E7664_03120, partial [Ruminococcaceae bacterium]|nr:hypothetical protein [Oscillospiraceae bacterium]